MDELTVGAAAARSGWSARMLRYLEEQGLVVPGAHARPATASTASRS